MFIVVELGAVGEKVPLLSQPRPLILGLLMLYEGSLCYTFIRLPPFSKLLELWKTDVAFGQRHVYSGDHIVINCALWRFF